MDIRNRTGSPDQPGAFSPIESIGLLHSRWSFLSSFQPTGHDGGSGERVCWRFHASFAVCPWPNPGIARSGRTCWASGSSRESAAQQAIAACLALRPQSRFPRVEKNLRPGEQVRPRAASNSASGDCAIDLSAGANRSDCFWPQRATPRWIAADLAAGRPNTRATPPGFFSSPLRPSLAPQKCNVKSNGAACQNCHLGLARRFPPNLPGAILVAGSPRAGMRLRESPSRRNTSAFQKNAESLLKKKNPFGQATVFPSALGARSRWGDYANRQQPTSLPTGGWGAGQSAGGTFRRRTFVKCIRPPKPFPRSGFHRPRPTRSKLWQNPRGLMAHPPRREGPPIWKVHLPVRKAILNRPARTRRPAEGRSDKVAPSTSTRTPSGCSPAVRARAWRNITTKTSSDVPRVSGANMAHRAATSVFRPEEFHGSPTGVTMPCAVFPFDTFVRFPAAAS